MEWREGFLCPWHLSRISGKKRINVEFLFQNSTIFIIKIRSASGVAKPLDPLTRGFALGPHWGQSPQNPIISHAPRSPWFRTPALPSRSATGWSCVWKPTDVTEHRDITVDSVFVWRDSWCVRSTTSISIRHKSYQPRLRCWRDMRKASSFCSSGFSIVHVSAS